MATSPPSEPVKISRFLQWGISIIYREGRTIQEKELNLVWSWKSRHKILVQSIDIGKMVIKSMALEFEEGGTIHMIVVIGIR